MKMKKLLLFTIIILASAFLLTIAVMPPSVSGKDKPVKDKPQWLTLDSAERLIQKYEEINGPDTYYIIEDDAEPMRYSNGDIITKTCYVGDQTVVTTAMKGSFKVHSPFAEPRIKIYIDYRYWEPMIAKCGLAVFVDPASYRVNFRYTDFYESGSGREEYWFDDEALNYKQVLMQYLDNWREDMVPSY